MADTLTEVRRELTESTDPENPSAEELRRLFSRIRRIAVIGLSRFPEKPARRVPSYLAAKGYEVIPVNPNADRILGKAAYGVLADVPEPVDLVIVFRPSDEAGRFVEEAVARPDQPAIWLQSGIRADDEIAAARAAGRLAVQDLCAFRVHRALSRGA
jgi:predicted CoA-binding protein